MKILFATKDVAAYNTCKPVVEELRNLGQTVGIAAEGVSLDRWQRDGEPLLLEGTLDPTKNPYPLDADAFLAEHQPKVLVIGFGQPIFLEKMLAAAAERAGIPTVWIENMWGVSGRVHSTPSLVFTNDAAGERMVQKHPSYQDCGIVRTGFSFLEELVISKAESDCLNKAQNEYANIILFAGSGPETTESMLAVVLASLMHEPKPFLLVPRLVPPKYKGESYEKRCQETLASFALDHPNCHVGSLEGVSTDAIASVAGITLSGGGTALLHSAYHRHAAVHVDIPEVRRSLGAQGTPWNVFPGVELGISYALREPVASLINFVKGPRRAELRQAQNVYFAAKTVSSLGIARIIVQCFS